MPVYEQTYRRYEAREPLRTVRFWPITREALRLLLSRWAFLALIVLAWLPFLGFAIYVWAMTQLGRCPRACCRRCRAAGPCSRSTSSGSCLSACC
jgi:hypothetical protein